MKDNILEINRLINALNIPAFAFNEIAAENNFPLVPIIQNLNTEKLELNSKQENGDAVSNLYALLKSAGAIASTYQQTLAKQPRDRDQINEAKLNYEQVRDNLVLVVEQMNA